MAVKRSSVPRESPGLIPGLRVAQVISCLGHLTELSSISLQGEVRTPSIPFASFLALLVWGIGGLCERWDSSYSKQLEQSVNCNAASLYQ